MSDRPDYLKRYVAAMFRACHDNGLDRDLYKHLWSEIDKDNEMLSELINIDRILPNDEETLKELKEELANSDVWSDRGKLEGKIARLAHDIEESKKRRAVLIASVGELRTETDSIYAAASAASYKQKESKRVAEISKLKKELKEREADLENLRSSKRRHIDAPSENLTESPADE